MQPVVEIVLAAERVRQSLESSERWAAALVGSSVRAPALPVRPLIRHLAAYHLVDVVRDSIVTARFALDNAGLLLEAEGITTAGARLSAWIATPTTESNQAAPLVWRPCDQSSTRLRPFFQVDRTEGVAFMRVDGATYAHLTVPIGRG